MSDMSIITRREVIKEVPARWRQTYGNGRRGQDKMDILKRLDALNLECCSSEDIDSIIGNASWTRLTCDQCNEDKDRIIRIGEEPDYEARWQDLCAGCLTKAVSVMTYGVQS